MHIFSTFYVVEILIRGLRLAKYQSISGIVSEMIHGMEGEFVELGFTFICTKIRS